MEDKFESAALLMPTVALRGLVVFPGMQVHFDVGREKSIDALKAALAIDNVSLDHFICCHLLLCIFDGFHKLMVFCRAPVHQCIQRFLIVNIMLL